MGTAKSTTFKSCQGSRGHKAILDTVKEMSIFALYQEQFRDLLHVNFRSPDILITILLASLPSLHHLKLPIKLLTPERAAN